MADYQTTEDIKEEVVDCGLKEVDSQDVHQLCTACLCATRITHTLSDGALKQYYMHILTEMQPAGGVVVSQSPRVCWECVSHLKRSVRFREQVQDSYRLLQPMLSMCDKEDLGKLLQSSVCRPARLNTCFAFSIGISPQDDDMQVMTAAAHDDEGASGSLENYIERRLSIFQEKDAAIAEDPLEAFCDEKYDVCVSEDVVESPPMCNYNIDNYQHHDRSQEQLDERYSYLRQEELNDTKTINTPLTHEASRHIDNNFVCDYCHKSYTSKAALERHIASYNIYPHINKTVPSPCADCAVVLYSDDQCSECPNKVYLHQRNNKDAKTAEKHFLSNECDKSFSVERNLTSDKKVHSGEKPIQCEMCHKIFTQKSGLIKHMRIHTGEKPFQCEVCHKSFAIKGVLIKHKRIHTGEKPYQCQVCNKSFAVLRNLCRHKTAHTDDKLFQCEVCPKSFAVFSYLKKHKRTHTGEKLFQCEVCPKSFTLLSYLNRHKRLHTGEKPFQCEVCPKSFAQNGSLTKHIRTHTGQKPYQCKVCDKSFVDISNLYQHTRIHTGEKPFQCEVCHKSFAQKKQILYHLRTHTGEKPYQCAECHKSYASKQSLMYHIRTHTNKTRRLTSV